MQISKIGVTICFIFIFVVMAPAISLGIPTPSLETHKQTAWKNAWESAWESAYITFLPADASEATNASGPDLSGNTADITDANELDVVWGTPFAADSRFVQYGEKLERQTSANKAFSEAGQPDYGKLYIRVQPAGAKITLRGVNSPFSQGMSLSPGAYIVDISRTGHLAQTRRIDLLPGMAATLDISLATAGTQAVIARQDTPTPETATPTQLLKNLIAPVSSDSQIASSAPAKQSNKSGALGKAPAYSPQTVRQTVPRSVKTEQGALFVSTEPADARVRILHIKPIFHQGIQLAPGRYTIDAVRKGFKRSVAIVQIAPNQKTNIHLALEKTPPKAKLSVQTTPAGAKVRILNIKPVFHQGIELDQGEYLLDAQLNGYATVTQKIRLAPGEDKNVVLTLPKAQKKGKLFVSTAPQSAKVRILSIKPIFRQGIELAAGSYTIDAKLAGYDTVVERVSIAPDAETHISLALSPSLAAKQATAAPEVSPVSVDLHRPAPIKQPERSPKNITQYDIDAYLSMASLAINSGNYDDAVQAGHKALELDSNCMEALKILGDAYLLAGVYDNAVREYDKALALSDEQQVRINRDYAFEKLQEEINALKAVQKDTKPGQTRQHQFALEN